MSELPPTQDVNEIAGMDGNTEIGSPIWGQLLSLKSLMPSLAMSKSAYTLGRESICDFAFASCMFEDVSHLNAVSKLHFRITREITPNGALVFIHDHSSNGTFINAQKIGKGKRQILSNNDEISIATKNCKCFVFVDLITVHKEFPVSLTSKYTVSRSLGRGACGEVRLVMGRESGEQYAMKIIQKRSFSFQARSVENKMQVGIDNRVQMEVAILKKLDHPCIVRIFDVIDTDDTLYIILELVKHGELFDRVVSLGQLPEDDAKFLFLQIVIATKYLHDNGITHRDMKPENILLSAVSNRCLIKVTDFGLSKFVDENTMLRTFCGTPTYLAPEVLVNAGGGVYTSAIDIWSLGVILYVCLVGYPPFTDERKDFDLQQQIVGGRYDFPEVYWKGVSDSAKDLIKKLLCVNPADRISLTDVLAHPWLSDQTIRSQLAELIETAGYPDLTIGLTQQDNCVNVPPDAANACSNGIIFDRSTNEDTLTSQRVLKRSADDVATECEIENKKLAF